MKHGCMVMTSRLSSSCRSGSCQIHHGWKSASSSQQFQVHVDLFFRHPRHCPQGICTPWSNHQWQVLKWLREGIRRKRPDKWKNNNWFLHHDNVPAHTSLVVWQFLTSKNITVIPQPPYSPDHAPCNFSYSPRWNYGWNGIVLAWLRRSTQNHKALLTHSHLRTSRDTWNHGKHAGITVYMHKGTTLKETVETRSYGKKLFFMVKFPEFLGSNSYNMVVHSSSIVNFYWHTHRSEKYVLSDISSLWITLTTAYKIFMFACSQYIFFHFVHYAQVLVYETANHEGIKLAPDIAVH